MKVTGQSVLTPRSKTMTGSCSQACSTAGRQRRGGVRRHDQDVAVAAGEQVVDVGDLLVVRALGIDVDELTDLVVERHLPVMLV
jgi:hypothetical protein